MTMVGLVNNYVEKITHSVLLYQSYLNSRGNMLISVKSNHVP